jgi:hypothetical protein
MAATPGGSLCSLVVLRGGRVQGLKVLGEAVEDQIEAQLERVDFVDGAGLEVLGAMFGQVWVGIDLDRRLEGCGQAGDLVVRVSVGVLASPGTGAPDARSRSELH